MRQRHRRLSLYPQKHLWPYGASLNIIGRLISGPMMMLKKSVINDIKDFFYDEVKDKFDIALCLEQMDKIIEKKMQIAKIKRK